LVECQLPKLKAGVVSDEDGGASEQAKPSPSRFPSTKSTKDGRDSIDADLSWLLSAWPRLPFQIQAGIISIVRVAVV
jgi:hypothetical protein